MELANNASTPARVQCVLERAGAACPRSVELWTRYWRYTLHTLKDKRASDNVLQRAARSVWWDGGVWVQHLELREMLGDADKEAMAADIQRIVMRALKAGLRTAEDFAK